jgi:hypothetical protein
VAATTATQVRPRREREEELLVWPDLVFIEFISAVLFTLSFTFLSALVNAPLINRANPDQTPNPSKAPWYFLNLQEMLLHMNAALAGVVLPTIALIALAAIPYFDRSREGQGTWFGTLNSVRISVFSTIYTVGMTTLLILFDSGKHVKLYTSITGREWPVGPKREHVAAHRPDWLPDVGIISAGWDLLLSPSVRSIQTQWTWRTDLGGLVGLFQKGEGHDGYLNWPKDFTQIPIPLNGTSFPRWGTYHGQPPPQWYQDLPNWLTGLFWYDLNLNLPAFLVEILIPTTIMITLSAGLLYILWRIGWVRTKRDIVIALFTGFIVVFWVMTIVGSAFRGAGQDLVLPWDVPRIDG